MELMPHGIRSLIVNRSVRSTIGQPDSHPAARTHRDVHIQDVSGPPRVIWHDNARYRLLRHRSRATTEIHSATAASSAHATSARVPSAIFTDAA